MLYPIYVPLCSHVTLVKHVFRLYDQGHYGWESPPRIRGRIDRAHARPRSLGQCMHGGRRHVELDKTLMERGVCPETCNSALLDLSLFAKMSEFLKSSPAPPSSGTVDARKREVMAQVKQELALANAQELMNKMNEKCFAKCITKPSTSLSSSEEVGQRLRSSDRSVLIVPAIDLSHAVYGPLHGGM